MGLGAGLNNCLGGVKVRLGAGLNLGWGGVKAWLGRGLGGVWGRCHLFQSTHQVIFVLDRLLPSPAHPGDM